MTQQQAILELFKSGKTLNVISCFKATGSVKLSARVHDLKQKGFVFKTEKKLFKTKYKTS